MSLHETQQTITKLRSVSSNLALLYERLSVVYAKQLANARGGDVDVREIEQNEENVLELLDLIEGQVRDTREQFEGGMSVVEGDLGATYADADDAAPFGGETDLADHVREVENTNESVDTYTCNLPGCSDREFNTLYGLTSHQRDDHDVGDESQGQPAS